jgi:uncharacterized membrane protein
MNRMRKVLRIVLGIASVIAVPIFIDFFVFGNAFPSNIDNQAWAGFLGSYLGGIATLVAVFITISDNFTIFVIFLGLKIIYKTIKKIIDISIYNTFFFAGFL